MTMIPHLVCLAFLLLLIGYCKWRFQYWYHQNLKYLQPEVPFGNIGAAVRFKENLAITVKRIYEKIKQKDWKHAGVYFLTSPTYFPVDLEHIRNIMTKDFEFFTDRNAYSNEKELLNGHLLNLRGEKWRDLRAKFNPSFTPGKMKMMFETVAHCQVNLLKKIDLEIDVKDMMSRFTIDVIGSCIFGLDFKSFEHEDAPFRVCGKRMFASTKVQYLKKLFGQAYPGLATRFNILLLPKDIPMFFFNTVKETVEYREKNNFRRNDLMQLLIDMKSNGLLTIEELASQCFIFFAAGFETSATLMTYALYELSKNQSIQERVRDEIDAVLVKYDGQVTYESIQDMKYLNQVIDETLRLYPPLPLVNRRCVKDYKIPNKDVIIEKGTPVIISVLGIHHDPEHYPAPEKFDPDRFSDEKKSSRHSYAFLPFGAGPRVCIAKRFGLMQSKVGLICLIKNYKFTVSQKTREPVEWQTHGLFSLVAVGGIWLNVAKVS